MIVKIGIVTDIIDFEKQKTGVANYIRYLVKNISKLNHNHTICLIHYSKNPDPMYQGANEIISPLIPIPPREIFTDVLRRPSLLKQNDIDIVHMPSPTTLGNSLFLVQGFKKVLTVHDLYRFFPQFRTKIYQYPIEWLDHQLWKPSLLVIKNRVDRYIADSNNTKKDLIRFLRVPEEKIKVIYLAPDEKFRQIDYKIPDEIGSSFILSNDIHSELIAVYYKLKKKGMKDKLVIFGASRRINRSFENEKKLWGLIKELDLQKGIIFLRYASDEELVKLYNTADLFVRPVRYEGFGLPPLEAMACGCPVIASNVASLPEVVGDAGILVDPYNVDEWVDTIHEVLTNQALREGLIKNGLERAKMFSWKKTAEETIKVYDEVYDNS